MNDKDLAEIKRALAYIGQQITRNQEEIASLRADLHLLHQTQANRISSTELVTQANKKKLTGFLTMPTSSPGSWPTFAAGLASRTNAGP